MRGIKILLSYVKKPQKQNWHKAVSMALHGYNFHLSQSSLQRNCILLREGILGFYFVLLNFPSKLSVISSILYFHIDVSSFSTKHLILKVSIYCATKEYICEKFKLSHDSKITWNRRILLLLLKHQMKYELGSISHFITSILFCYLVGGGGGLHQIKYVVEETMCLQIQGEKKEEGIFLVEQKKKIVSDTKTNFQIS